MTVTVTLCVSMKLGTHVFSLRLVYVSPACATLPERCKPQPLLHDVGKLVMRGLPSHRGPLQSTYRHRSNTIPSHEKKMLNDANAHTHVVSVQYSQNRTVNQVSAVPAASNS